MKKNILIIEDEEAIAKAEAMILGSDFNIHVAKDGEQGFKMAKEIKPELVVLDLMLPKRGGYDVCFNIRQDDELKNTKILMVTAKAQEIDEDKGMMVGADHYLRKPFEPQELRAQVKRLLEND